MKDIRNIFVILSSLTLRSNIIISNHRMEDIDSTQNVPEDAGYFHQFAIFVATNPWDFCWYLLIFLSPLFSISAYLSWKLAKAIEQQEKNKIKRSKKSKNINKVKRK